MTAFSAKSDVIAGTAHQMVFVIYPEIALLDLAGPLQVFAWARHPETGARAYQIQIVSWEGGRVESDSLVSIDTDPMGDQLRVHTDTLVVIGGDGVYRAAENPALVARISELADTSDRICSVCSGAYLLAAAGLLDDRRAVTHWQDAEILQRDFPRVRLELDPIFIKDGKIWTSAGVTSGTDMALAIVAEDLGQEAALERAQALVTYMVRPGGQSQFSPALQRQTLDRSGKFQGLHQWIADNLQSDLRVERLAEHQNMSLRSFHRVYQSKMGVTPARGVERIRVEAARDLLETTAISLKAIATRCGYGSEDRMRRAFTRTLGISPSDYRARFQSNRRDDG